MSNQAWYRLLRPIRFSDVVGQEDTIKILKNSIINQNFNHAYLFSGAKGTGKTSVAKILAKTINCENNQAGETCQSCNSCQKMAKHQEHVDILEIDGASNNGVDEIRTIKKNVNILPMELKYKIYIIDEVHMLTIAAFNALLKTLEEPPKHIIFIFATTEPNKVPETIISRCHWFTFSKIELSKLETVFIKILNDKQIEYELSALHEIAILSDGSLRDGINHLEKVSNFSKKIELNIVIQLFAIIAINEKIAFLFAFFNHDFEKILVAVNRFNLYASDFKQIILQILQVLLDLALVKITNNSKIAKILTISQIEQFASVDIKDIKIALNEFAAILNAEGNNETLLTLTIAQMLNVSDKFKPYQLTLMPEKNKPVMNKNKKIIDIDVSNKKSTKANKSAIKSEQITKPNKTKIDEPMPVAKSIIDSNLQNNVMNVLIQADVKVRKLLKLAWLKINELISNNKFRNLSKIYLSTNISAASKNALIIICENIIQAELINKKFVFKEHRDFLKFVLGDEFMVYALDKNQWKAIGQYYQEQNAIKNLPKPFPIVIPIATKEETTESKSETLTFLKKFFSEIEEI